MEKLTFDTLESIFEYLSVSDKLTVCLVCKNYNNLIGTSTNLMSDVKLTIDRDVKRRGGILDAILNTSRKYHTVEITRNFRTSQIPKLIEFFELVGKNVKKLKINVNKISAENFFTLLNFLPNLEIFQSEYVTLVGFFEYYVSLPKLKNLKILSGTSIVNQTFCNILSSTTNLESVFLTSKIKPIQALKVCLIRQRKLKHLSLYDSGFVNLFDDEFLSNAQFQLESFLIRVNAKIENIKKFLETQNKLKKLDIRLSHKIQGHPYLVQLINTIFKLKNLKVLEASTNYVSFGIPFSNCACPNLEVLNIEFGSMNAPNLNPIDDLKIFCKLMPNLKRMELRTSYQAQDTDLICFNLLQNLEFLKISALDCTIMKHFDLKNLKSFKCEFAYEDFRIIMSTEDWIPFFEKHKNLNYIEISNVFLSPEVWEYVENFATNINYVKFNFEHRKIYESSYPELYHEKVQYFKNSMNFVLKTDKCTNFMLKRKSLNENSVEIW